MFEKGSFKDEDNKEEWKKILTMEFVSSEESGMEEDDEVIIIRPLPWLSSTVTEFKLKLDAETKLNRTPLARRQLKKRINGMPSDRARPATDNIPTWVYN